MRIPFKQLREPQLLEQLAETEVEEVRERQLVAREVLLFGEDGIVDGKRTVEGAGVPRHKRFVGGPERAEELEDALVGNARGGRVEVGSFYCAGLVFLAQSLLQASSLSYHG